MKIPFDIKYRPQIESGEFKVETRDGLPARVVCWDANSYTPIVFLATEHDGLDDIYKEYTYSCNNFGRAFSIESPRDLFIVTPEEELTEFEKEVSDMVEYCKEHGEYVAFDYAKRHAKTLLALAKKQLQPEIDAEIEKAYKTQDDVVFHKGWEQGRTDALKNLPRWKQIKNCDTTVRKPHIGTNMIGEKMLYIGNNCISISKIMKLPGFNS